MTTKLLICILAVLCCFLVTITETSVRANTPAAVPKLAIIDKPIRFGERRRWLTLRYYRKHESTSATSIEIVPRVIVLHHTGGRTLQGAWRYFNRPTMARARRRLRRAGRVNVSTHFVVDRDGTIYRLMPETWMARHCVGLNHVAIGIENVGGTRRAPLTAAQVSADAKLIRYLVAKYRITHLIGHYEYRRFEGHPYFRERQRHYRTRKRDPGPQFMRQVRQRVADLGLAGAPTPGHPLTGARGGGHGKALP